MLNFWNYKLLFAIWIASLCTVGSNAFSQTYFNHQKLITQKDFFNKFELREYIGGGGESLVYKVLHKEDQKAYALVVRCQMDDDATPLNSREDYFNRLILNQEVNPHQAKIYDVFWLRNKNYPFAGHQVKGVLPCGGYTTKIPHGKLLDDRYESDPEAISYRHLVLMLQLGEGDLESDSYKEKNIDELSMRAQMMANDYSLSRAGIRILDDRRKNRIFTCSKQERHQNKWMFDYDFWHYKIYGYEFYLPKQAYLIKRIDYNIGDAINAIFEPDLENWQIKFMEEIIQKFGTRPESGAILDILN